MPAIRRHAGLGAAGQRRHAGRPLVQISPPARHPLRRAGGAERAGRAALKARGASPTPGDHGRAVRRAGARSQNRWPSLAFDMNAVNQLLAPISIGRLLLQDLHVAGGVLGEGLRAADPPRRRPWPGRRLDDPDTYEKAHAFCDVLVIGAGPAGLAAALAAGTRRRARDPVRRGFCARRPLAERHRGRSMAQRLMGMALRRR
jgi:NADPH-dependent 2,4-dienoyl-CoA reductase/sulfur reductase-like enzyme